MERGESVFQTFSLLLFDGAGRVAKSAMIVFFFFIVLRLFSFLASLLAACRFLLYYHALSYVIDN